MSIGYTGMCKKALEDNEIIIYTYAGENWNDGGKSKINDTLLQDGIIAIYKSCLEEPEIHEHIKRLPSGKKRVVTKRITHFPSICEHLANGSIVVEKECKNAFYKPEVPIDYLAYRLLIRVFERYQQDGALPSEETFIQ